MSTEPNTSTKRPRLFERLVTGLGEGIEWARKKQDLSVTTITIPDPPPAYDAKRIRALREHLHVSQQGFSRLLNVSPKTVQSWEQGTRLPSQASLRLLQVIEDPQVLMSALPKSATPDVSGGKLGF